MIAALHASAPQVIAAAAPANASLGGAGEVLRVVLSLVAVVVMILVVGWLTRRMQSRVRPGGQRVRCVESLMVGVKERVLLLEVGKQQLLVGTSPSGLRTLLVLDEPVAAPQPSATTPNAPISFRDALIAQWKKRR